MQCCIAQQVYNTSIAWGEIKRCGQLKRRANGDLRCILCGRLYSGKFCEFFDFVLISRIIIIFAELNEEGVALISHMCIRNLQ